jgi:hypothetical protein
MVLNRSFLHNFLHLLIDKQQLIPIKYQRTNPFIKYLVIEDTFIRQFQSDTMYNVHM